MQPVLEKNINAVIELCKSHHVKKLYAFGSVISGDFTEDSDVDLLYEMDYSGFDFDNLKDMPYDPFLVFCDLKERLENVFTKKVDLIPNQDFKNPYFVKEMEKTKTLLYAQSFN